MLDNSYLFISLVAINLFIKSWLNQRHAANIQKNANTVPNGFLESVPLEVHQKAAAYSVAKVRFNQVSLVIDTLWLLLLTLGGGIDFIYSLASHLVNNETNIITGLIFLGILGCISGIIDLPLSIYKQFVLEQQFGFNRTTPSLFLVDLLRNALVSVVIGLPLLLLILWLLNLATPMSWLWAWMGWMAFNALLLFIYPVAIAPLFNKFTPMPESVHKQKLDALLERCNFSTAGLFIMDGSRRSAHANAYFTGFGKHRRIVLFDTLIAQLSPAQLEAVLAHEIGHYQKKHLQKRLVMMALISLVLLWTLFQLLNTPWFYKSLGVSIQNPATALALFSLVMPLCLLPLTPLSNAVSRKHEYEADSYSAANSNATELISALLTMYKENAATLTPDPLYSLFHDSHPPATLRINHLLAQQGNIQQQ